MKASEITLAEPPPMGVVEALKVFNDGNVKAELWGSGEDAVTPLSADQIRAALPGLVGWNAHLAIHQLTISDQTWAAWLEVCAEARPTRDRQWFSLETSSPFWVEYFDWKGVDIMLYGRDQ